jgi:hypothetical protein
LANDQRPDSTTKAAVTAGQLSFTGLSTLWETNWKWVVILFRTNYW